jgi:hypothetical protein
MNCILYYHIFPGPSLEKVLKAHAEILVNESLFDEIRIYSWSRDSAFYSLVNNFLNTLKSIFKIHFEAHTEATHINEFATLRKLQENLSQHPANDWISYCHTKGSTHADNSNSRSKSELLLRILVRLARIVKANEAFREFFNLAGSDLAWANFKGLGPAQLHFSGNFWISRVSYLTSLPQIVHHQSRSLAHRFRAEGWIGSTNNPAEMKVFNGFSPFRFHYDSHTEALKPNRIIAEIDEYASNPDLWEKTQIYFDAVCLHHQEKIDSLIQRTYSKTLMQRRRLHAFLEDRYFTSEMWRLVLSACNRTGVTQSRFGLFSIYLPAHASLSRYV